MVSNDNIKIRILNYMRTMYEDADEVRFYSSDVVKDCQEWKSELQEDRIRSIISALKRDGKLVDLDEKRVDGFKPFTLKSILDELKKAEPKKAPIMSKFLEPKAEDAKPANPPVAKITSSSDSDKLVGEVLVMFQEIKAALNALSHHQGTISKSHTAHLVDVATSLKSFTSNELENMLKHISSGSERKNETLVKLIIRNFNDQNDYLRDRDSDIAGGLAKLLNGQTTTPPVDNDDMLKIYRRGFMDGFNAGSRGTTE